MRYVTVLVRPREGRAFHPLGRELAEDPEVTREAIHKVELLDDGTGAMLGEVRGNLDRYREILEHSGHVYEYSVSGTDWGYSYTHFEPTELTRELMSQRRETEVMVDMPSHYTDNGALRVTFVGNDAAFQETFAMMPDELELEVLETGEYHPDMRQLFSQLTDRQQEILEAAVREGYYENPREATHQDIADRLDLSPGTVGEHLRKIESRVFAEFIRKTA